MAVKSKTEGTTTNLGNEQYSATDAEAAAFDLNPYLLDLMWNEPFYSKILRGITKVKTEAIPTAGVMVKDGDITMLWNPKFLASLITALVENMNHTSFGITLRTALLIVVSQLSSFQSAVSFLEKLSKS